jgi:hypothetical protein
MGFSPEPFHYKSHQPINASRNTPYLCDWALEDANSNAKPRRYLFQRPKRKPSTAVSVTRDCLRDFVPGTESVGKPLPPPCMALSRGCFICLTEAQWLKADSFNLPFVFLNTLWCIYTSNKTKRREELPNRKGQTWAELAGTPLIKSLPYRQVCITNGVLRCLCKKMMHRKWAIETKKNARKRTERRCQGPIFLGGMQSARELLWLLSRKNIFGCIKLQLGIFWSIGHSRLQLLSASSLQDKKLSAPETQAIPKKNLFIWNVHCTDDCIRLQKSP